MSEAMASRILRHLHGCTTPQRPCKIACSASITDVGLRTPKVQTHKGQLLVFVQIRPISSRMVIVPTGAGGLSLRIEFFPEHSQYQADVIYHLGFNLVVLEQPAHA